MQALTTYDPIERYTGNGMLDEYTFDFLIIQASEILILVLDDDDEEIERFRGDELNAFLDSLEFDETNGGGTVTLTDNLPTGYTLTLLLAPDEPKQTSNFTTAGTFNLPYLQAAFNKLGSLIQRVSWLAQRSIRLNDSYNDVFDPQLPLVLEADRTIVVNPTGTGLVQGPSIDELLQASQDVLDAEAAALAAQEAQVAAEDAQIAAELAETNAETAESNAAGSAVAAAASAIAASGSASAASASAIAAAASAAAALTSENNAETAETNAETAETGAVVAQVAAEAAAASIIGGALTGPFAVNQNSNSDLVGEVTDSADYLAVNYIAWILRGTTVFARQEFTIFYRNGGWKYSLGPGRRDDASVVHGVTFTAHATTAQINADVDNSGAGNAQIWLQKFLLPS